MNITIYAFIFVGLFFTIRNYKNWISKDYKIPVYFFLSWKFVLYVASIIFITVGFFYAKYPLDDIGIFIALITGVIIGLINTVISTAEKIE